MNFHAEASGRPANGMTTSPHAAEPTTTVAVSSSESPPGADLRSAFHPACRNPAARTASVMPNVSSGAGIGVASDAARRNGIRLLQPCLCQHPRLLEDRIGDRADVRIDATPGGG